VRNADLKGRRRSLGNEDLAARAKIVKLKLDEFQGGGFTLSPTSAFSASTAFSAITQPAAGYDSGVGMGEERAVVRKGMVRANNMIVARWRSSPCRRCAMGAQYPSETLRAMSSSQPRCWST